MFTGIIQTVGRVAAATPTPAGLRFEIDTQGWVPDRGYQPAPGDSIAVSGVCLTIADIQARKGGGGGDGVGTISFDVITETLNKTTLGRLKTGSPVNLEPAVLPTQPMGGHVVQGHVDATGEVTAIDNNPADWRLTLRPPLELMPTMVPKGSVCIDGVSLTLADRTDDTITVALIPTTLELTTLANLKPGDPVNLEADVLVKAIIHTIHNMTQPEKGGQAEAISMDFLQRAGFTS
ncbi:riboflavin synthase [Mucisphaera sp.]|uniref:riboflavin synthase n=1 Tax=Mucisphaera sp. TaxID=2913024 RepID=UPI003D0D1BD5